MPSAKALLPRLTLLIAILGSAHYFVWTQLVRDCVLPAPWPALSAAGFAVMVVGLPLARLMSHARWVAQLPWLPRVPLCWVGFFFILLWCTAAGGVLRQLYRVAGPFLGLPMPADPVALSRIFATCTFLVAALLAAIAVRTALGGPRVVRVPVNLARLPQALNGITLAQISDLHVADFIGRSYVERLVAQTNALKPDLVVLTGDLVDGPLASLQDAAAPLAHLEAKYGVFFITGNHEYFSGADAWVAEFRRLGIQVLRNEHVSIGDATASFDLAGVDDLMGAAFGQGCDFAAATSGRDPSRALVLLAHQPKAVLTAAGHGVDLMLSGHTHGGQIWPFGLLVLLAQPILAGLARHGDTQVYVNRGTGFWGPPMRLGVPAELTLLTLHASG